MKPLTFLLMLVSALAHADVFTDAKVQGAFILLDVDKGTAFTVNPALVDKRFLPASTYKIPNTLIGLETGVISGETFTLPWDGKKREIDAWNRDQDLQSALRESVVWFYQEVARRIGQARMQAWVDKLGYGNRDLSGGVDRFWLDGGLRISPREQAELLRKLITGKLPVKPEHVALVRKLLVVEETPGYTIRAKTGTAIRVPEQLGWLVGEVDAGDARYTFATLILGEHPRPLRLALTKKLLAERGVISATPR
jgi:beta-lactamase class D